MALTGTYSGDSNYSSGNTASPGDADGNRAQRAAGLDHDGYRKQCDGLAFRAHQPIDHRDWEDRFRGAHAAQSTFSRRELT